MKAVAQNLAGRRGANLLFSGVSFEIGSGEGLAVTGPNGVGKSTLLKIIAGLLPADGGIFDILERDGTVVPVSEGAHYLGHGNAMKNELTVRENLSFWQTFQAGEGGGEEAHGLDVDEAIDAVELDGTAHLPFGYLSAGQKRRIALARLLLNDRPLWLLDEPTAALDKRSDLLFCEIAADHLERGGMLIAATHLPLEIPGMKPFEMTRPAGTSHEADIWS